MKAGAEIVLVVKTIQAGSTGIRCLSSRASGDPGKEKNLQKHTGLKGVS